MLASETCPTTATIIRWRRSVSPRHALRSSITGSVIERGHKTMIRAKAVKLAQDEKDLQTDALDFEGAGADINVARTQAFL